MHAAPLTSTATAAPADPPATAPSGPPARGARLLRMAWHLTPTQVAARARFMLLRRLYALAPGRPIEAARRAAAGADPAPPLPALPRALIAPEGAARTTARAAALSGGRFVYLGRERDYRTGIHWRDPAVSPLWAFNLHYLGAVLDLVLAERVGDARRILAEWTAEFGHRWDPVAWHPYPTSLRLTNLCCAAIDRASFDALGADCGRLAATHAAFLLRHLERDLRGNHLLENAVALLMASACLRGPLALRCGTAARTLLAAEIPEQVRGDGSHFELSPMYLLLVMQRCLQALALLDPDEPLARDTLAPAVARMACFLSGIVCPDGDIPPLGDAVRAFAPPPAALLALAERLLGTRATPPPPGVTSFDDAGLHVFRDRRTWAIFDAGPVCADYLPGHGQADSLTVEVWCDGACVVGDPGVHEYTGPERAWGRSSRAHSTVTVDDADTSEVFGSFRIGGRARITGVAREPRAVTATLRPFGVRADLTRRVQFAAGADAGIEILDSARVPPGRTARARLHLHPAVELLRDQASDARTVVARSPAGLVRIAAQHPLQLERGRASRQYGLLEPTTILVQPLVAGAATFSVTPLDAAR